MMVIDYLKFIILLVFVAPQAYGDAISANTSYAELDKRYSDKYYSGRYLMYDCHDQHWVCTDIQEVRECQRLLERSIAMKEDILPCQYFKEFDNIKDCVLENLRLVANPTSKRFCYHPSVFKRNILFK
jgi:hypothetical protein